MKSQKNEIIYIYLYIYIRKRILLNSYINL